MNENTKVTLSDGELAIAMDKEFILTKRIIIEKVAMLFNEQINIVSDIMKESILMLPEVSAAVPKISKGENYNGLPYVMFDYPHVFEKENIFALRTFFWWGNFFSISIQLSGKYKAYFEENIFKNLSKGDWFVCVNENEWQHHFEDSNYKFFTLLTEAERASLKLKGFIKIALKYELHHWNMMQQLLPQGYKKINDLLLP